MKGLSRIVVALFLISISLPFQASADETAIIAVASNLSHAIRDIGKDFTAQTQHRLRFSFGSSGNLAHQIARGSPHEMFLSADTSNINRLKRMKKTQADPIVYARGGLCLYVPQRSSFHGETDISKILHAIQFNRYKKISLANPALAPYGKATIQTLNSLGMWGFDPRKLVIAENITQATQFALTQSVDLAFIPVSHRYQPKVEKRGKCLLIDEHLHQPIAQSMVLTTKAGNTAKAFFDFMISNHAQDILREHGYRMP